MSAGINFQKASCTLDGCVKVWTSRVDSVATETGKLLSGLAGGMFLPYDQALSLMIGNADDGEEGDGEEDEEGGETRKTRKVGAITFDTSPKLIYRRPIVPKRPLRNHSMR